MINEVNKPPTMGAATRFITSAPVPIDQIMGMRPIADAPTVIIGENDQQSGTVLIRESQAGILGSGAQFCMTRAYQAAPAALVSAVGYLAPVLSLAWGIAFFAQLPGQNALLGSSLIVLFGVILKWI